MKLTQLIEAEADLIKADAKRKLIGELEAKSGYRTAATDLGQEIRIEEAKEMLAKKGYSQQSIDSVLRQYNQEAMIVRPETGIDNIDAALDVLDARRLYEKVWETRKFMLKLRNTGINLEFPTVFDGCESKAILKAWPRFVNLKVIYSTGKYSVNFAPFYITNINENNGYAENDSYFFPIPIFGLVGMLIIYFDRDKILSYKEIQKAVLNNGKEKKIYEHIAGMKDETEQALIQKAREMLKDEPKMLNEAQTKLLTTLK